MPCAKCCDECCVVAEFSGFGHEMPATAYGWLQTVGSTSRFSFSSTAYVNGFGRRDITLEIGWSEEDECPEADLQVTVFDPGVQYGIAQDCTLLAFNAVPPKVYIGQSTTYSYSYKKLDNKKIINPCTSSYFDFTADDATSQPEGLPAGRVKVKRLSRQGDGGVNYQNRLHAGDLWIPLFEGSVNETSGNGGELQEIICESSVEIVGSNSFEVGRYASDPSEQVINGSSYVIEASPITQQYSLTRPNQIGPAFVASGLRIDAAGFPNCLNEASLALRLQSLQVPLANLTVTTTNRFADGSVSGTSVANEVLLSTYPNFTSTIDFFNSIRSQPRNAFGYTDSEGRYFRALLGHVAVGGTSSRLPSIVFNYSNRLLESYQQDGEPIFSQNSLPLTIFDETVAPAVVNLYAMYEIDTIPYYGTCTFQPTGSRYNREIDPNKYIQFKVSLKILAFQ